MKYDLVLWDYDGTIADTRPAIVAGFQAAAGELGLDVPAEETVIRVIGKGLRECVSLLFPEPGEYSVPEIADMYRAMYHKHEPGVVRLFPGIADTIRTMSESGVPMAAASNKGHAALGVSIERFGLAPYFQAAAGSGGTDVPGKPDTALYEQVVLPELRLVDTKFSPERILMVGDTDIDLNFGTNIRADRCWCAYGYGSRETCAVLEPEYIAETPADIAGFME